MKSCLKTLMIGTGLVLLLVGAVGLFLASQAKSWARTGVERSLSVAFGAPVQVESVSWTYGVPGVTIGGVEVANPEGFAEGPAVRCDAVHARIDPRTWVSGAAEIARLEVAGAEINVEYDLLKGSNVGTLLENAKRVSALVGRGRGADERRFVIRQFHCDAAVVNVRAGQLSKEAMRIEVDPFSLQDLGADQALTSGEVGSLVLRNVLRESIGFKGMLKPVASLLNDVIERFDTDGAGPEDATAKPLDPPLLE